MRISFFQKRRHLSPRIETPWLLYHHCLFFLVLVLHIKCWHAWYALSRTNALLFLCLYATKLTCSCQYKCDIEIAVSHSDVFSFSHLAVLCAGPGSYNVFEHGIARESFKKAFLERTRKGGFGSTSERSSIFHNKELIEAPSPGQYEVGSHSCSHSLIYLVPFFLKVFVLILFRLKYKVRGWKDTECHTLYRL